MNLIADTFQQFLSYSCFFNTDLTIDKMFSTVTHFRMQRQAVTATDAAYTVQATVQTSAVKETGKTKKSKPKKTSERGINKPKITCTLCGKRNHEEKDCPVKKYREHLGVDNVISSGVTVAGQSVVAGKDAADAASVAASCYSFPDGSPINL
ncbi:hypothetical protein V1506DRAFT_542166, partial [Lipomyces tetrasporus]